MKPVVVRRSPESAELQITWNDGVVTALKYALLRECCRCAHCRADATSRSGTSAAVVDVAPFGDYALRLFFDDGHDRGLYPFEYLRELCHTEAEA
jgi:DUF971 family protein